MIFPPEEGDREDSILVPEPLVSSSIPWHLYYLAAVKLQCDSHSMIAIRSDHWGFPKPSLMLLQHSMRSMVPPWQIFIQWPLIASSRNNSALVSNSF